MSWQSSVTQVFFPLREVNKFVLKKKKQAKYNFLHIDRHENTCFPNVLSTVIVMLVFPQENLSNYVLPYSRLYLQSSRYFQSLQVRPQKPLPHDLLPFSPGCGYLWKHRTQPDRSNLDVDHFQQETKGSRNQRLFLFPQCLILKTCKLTEKLKDQCTQNH